jgi:GNAT superfamily N-acetyltransferase
MDGRLEPADTEFIDRHWRELWGLPLVSVRREYMPSDVEGLVYKDEWGAPQGLVTWHIDGNDAEIVSVDAFEQGRHIGGRLVDGAEGALRQRGIGCVTIITTADNLRALAFYVRRGYRLVAVHLDAMDRVRKFKPEVPLTGHDGLPLRDMLELKKDL